MDIRTIRYFLAVAKYENITKAAEELMISQPPLSKQIRLLEEELGMPLFERNKKRLKLTEEGYFLKARGERIVELFEKTEMELEEMRSGKIGTISIGTLASTGFNIVPKLIEKFAETYPDVKYNIWEGSTDEILEKLESGVLDIAMVRKPYDMEKFEGYEFKRENLVAVMSADSPLYTEYKEGIPLEVLSGEKLILLLKMKYIINKAFEDMEKKWTSYCQCNSVINAFTWVKKGLGIAVLPESIIPLMDYTLAAVPIIEPELFSTASVLWVKGRYQSMAARKFIELIHELDMV